MDSRDRIIEELRALVAEQAAQLELQAARIRELELALAKAMKDSSTSSKPPSSDIAKPKPKPKKSSRRKPRKGGQPGHQRQLRQPLPPDRIDEIIEHEIEDDEVTRLGLTPTGEFEIVQHFELPETPVHVTEHQLTVYEDGEGQLCASTQTIHATLVTAVVERYTSPVRMSGTTWWTWDRVIRRPDLISTRPVSRR